MVLATESNGSAVTRLRGTGADGVTRAKRKLYACGRYLRTAGAECQHNQVDGEALLRFLLSTTVELVRRMSGREKLRVRLEKIARQEKDPSSQPREQGLVRELELKVAALRQDLDTAARRLATERDEARYAAIAEQFDLLQKEAVTKEAEVAKLRRSSPANPRQSIEEEVDAAMRLFDDIERLCDNPSARPEIAELFQKLDVHIGLQFGAAVKGKSRKVRLLLEGVVAFGGAALPVPTYGPNNRDPGSTGFSKPVLPPRDLEENTGCHRDGAAGEPLVRGDQSALPAAPDVYHRPEEISFTKVNRGERTPVELFRDGIRNEIHCSASPLVRWLAPSRTNTHRQNDPDCPYFRGR